MSSSISGVSSALQQAQAAYARKSQAMAADNDGDNDGSKARAVQAAPKPISPTIGNTISTTA
jgi:hypothetical protein